VADAQSTRLIALRGATTVDADARGDIKQRTEELLTQLLQRNALAVDDIVSILFTATPDLRSDFPAAAARAIGLAHTPLLCAQEIPVEGAMERCVRVLIHCYAPAEAARHHVYLHEAQELRLDLPSSRAGAAQPGADQGRAT
jgi:chorismate mutase